MSFQYNPVKLETPPQTSEAEDLSSDESDDFSVSEDDDDILALGLYSEASEQRPRSAAYDTDLQQVSTDVRNILGGASEALEGCDSDHPRYKVAFDRIQELKDDPKAPKRRINIVGRTGAGKSSLLNSLLGRLDAARAHSASKACTHVPTSYQSPFSSQTKSFAARIELFTQDESYKKLDTMLRDYILVHSDANKDCTPEELAEIQSDAATAFEAFRTLFCMRDEFLSAEAGHQFLKQSSETSRSVTVDKFVSWWKQLQTEQCPDLQDTTFFFEADTQQALLDYLEQFAFSNRLFKAPAMWPLVKMIHQGLGVEILQHAIIVDWPGSGDTNQLRANASSERIFDCDEIWIVSDVSRIIDDPIVRTNLLRYSNTIQCIIVCTGIDADLDNNLAAEIQRHGYDTGSYDALRGEEKSLEQSIVLHTNKIQTYESVLQTGSNKRQKISEKKQAGIAVKKANLETALKAAQTKLPEIKNQCFESLLAVRKPYISGEFEEEIHKRILLEGKEDNLREESLRLHFVANTHYAAHKGGQKIDGPQLSPEATGIPALRARILEAAAPMKMSALKNYLDHKVTVLLHGIDLLGSPASLRGCEGALDVVKEKQTRVRPFALVYRQLVEEGIDSDLMVHLKDNQEGFVDAACEHLGQKKKWSYPSIGAFVRNDGCHATTAIGYRSWTDEFLKSAAEEILARWNSVIIDEESAFMCLEEKLIAECKDIAVKMKEDAAGFVLPMDRFDEFIKGHVQGIKQLCQTYRTEIARDYATIKIEATQADEQCPTGYFKVAMQEAWDVCKEFTGPGTKAKILTTLESYLKLKAERSPFAMLASSIKSHMLEDAADLLEELVSGVENIVQDIRKQLEAMFHEDLGDPIEVEQRRRLKRYAKKAIPELVYARETVRMIERRYENDE